MPNETNIPATPLTRLEQYWAGILDKIEGGGGGGGGGGAAQKNINFIDYDGTILYSYTSEEFAALTAMPENPSHAGLTAQGWNWTLAKAQAYVAKYGKLWVGQMYITDDGKTHIHFHLDSLHLKPYLGFGLNGTAIIDWGDGSQTETVAGTNVSILKQTPHEYTTAGNYEITIDVTTGSIGLLGTVGGSNGSSLLSDTTGTTAAANYYRKHITAVEIGNSITSIGPNAFYNCYALQSVVIPDSITGIFANAFYNCYALQSVVIPDRVTNIANGVFQYCSALQSVVIPNGVTSIARSTFQYCYALQNVVIPDSVTSITDSAFASCSGLPSIVIPDSVTSIGISAFRYCYEMIALTFESTTPPTLGSSDVFGALPTDCIIYVPAGTLAAYTSATNYPSSSSYTYVEY